MPRLGIGMPLVSTATEASVLAVQDFFWLNDVSGELTPIHTASRTNLIPYSEDFTDGSWAKQNVTVSSGFTSPDGTLNATEILETAVSGNHGAYYALNPASGGTDYSVSISFYIA